MSGEVTFTPTQRDYIEANRLWARSSRQRRPLFWVAVVVLALAVINIVFDLTAGIPLGRAVNDVLIELIAGVVLLLAPLLTSMFLGRSVASMFAQRLSMADAVHARWDDEGLILSASSGLTNQPWSTLHRWVADARSIVFLPTDRMMLLIPMRSLSAEQAADLRDTAERHGPSMGKPRR